MKNLIREKLDVRKRGYDWLSEKTGLTKAQICRIVTGQARRPSIITAHKLAHALDCTIEELWIFDR